MVLGHDGGAASVCVNAEDPAAALQALGGAGVILATVASGKPTAALIAGPRARGRMVVVGASPDPIEVPPAPLLFGTRAVEGALTGPPLASEDTSPSACWGDSPGIETVPLEAAAAAYGKMMRNEARFRMVLVTGY